MAAGFVASNIGNGTASTRALTLTLTSGQAVAFGVIWESTATFSSVASSLGNTYTLRGTEQTLGASKMRVYTADNVSGGSETITVTFSASNYSVILGMNVNGVSTAAYDGLGGPTTDTSSPWTSATVSPSIPDAILVSFVTNDSANVGTWTAGNGFTKGAEDGDGSTSWSVSQAYKVVATTAADNGSWTCSQGTNAIVWTLAFKGIPAAPTITTQPTNQSALIGQTATFSVTATGATSYQWNSSPTSQITVASEAQQSANYNSTTGTTETVTITVGAGASVDLYATSDSASLPSGSVSSSPAATWTQRDSVGNSTTLLKHYTADGLSAGSYVITITWASAVAFRAMLARQITGTSGYDLAASAAHSANYQSLLGSTAADAITSGLTSTLSTQPALISGFTANISSPTVTPVAGTGFTTFGAVWPQTNNTAIAEHKRITSTTALAATFTSPVTATTYATATAVFREGIAVSGATSSSYTTPTLVGTDNGTLYYVDCTNTYGTTTSNTVRLLVSSNGVGTLGMFDPEMRILGWF